MEILDNAKSWLWSVAAKKMAAAVLGALSAPKVAIGLAWLAARGLNVQVDPVTLAAACSAAAVALHDWLKLKFPDSKWL